MILRVVVWTASVADYSCTQTFCFLMSKYDRCMFNLPFLIAYYATAERQLSKILFLLTLSDLLMKRWRPQLSILFFKACIFSYCSCWWQRFVDSWSDSRSVDSWSDSRSVGRWCHNRRYICRWHCESFMFSELRHSLIVHVHRLSAS